MKLLFLHGTLSPRGIGPGEGVLACLLALVFAASPAPADIFQWEYINPADPSQGKQQSTALAPDGAGVDAVPAAYIANRDLTIAYLINADLCDAYFIESTLTNAEFSGANLSNAKFGDVDLTGADFRGAKLSYTLFGFCHGDAICGQRFATLTEADFTNADLSSAGFYGATLMDVSFTGSQVRGANFARHRQSVVPVFGTGITPAQLYSTASYRAHDLSGIDLASNDLSGANFADQNLADASFAGATLTDVDFTRAVVRGAEFNKLLLPIFSCGITCSSSLQVGTGITLAQIYSTASYQDRDLSGIRLSYHNLTDANLVGQNLSNALLYAATLTGANVSAADMRGAYISSLADVVTTNLILPNGRIDGLDLDAGDRLVIHDDDGGLVYYPYYYLRPPIQIMVDQHLSMGPGGALRMVFEADAWDSTISFAPGIPVALDGTLELTFAADVNLATQLGRTFDIFDWTGVTPTGAFAVSSPYRWDLANLYTTGDVTLTAVPEASSLSLALMVALLNVKTARRRSTQPISIFFKQSLDPQAT